MYKSGGKGDRVKSELEKYLGDYVEMHRDKFDILNWWRVNAQRFPILSKMARDILAVPVSTVASESAFSTGGRVLDTFRSSLSPKIVQALICTQDWIRKDSKPISIEEDLSELEVVEKGTYLFFFLYFDYCSILCILLIYFTCLTTFYFVVELTKLGVDSTIIDI